MKKSSWLCTHAPQLVVALFVIQPLMDTLSYWTQEWGVSSLFTLGIRFGVLFLTVLFGFLLSDRKWIYYTAAGVFLFLGVGHVFACLQVGYQAPFADLANYIRVIQMPLTVICLITFLRRNEMSFDAMQLGLTLALLLTLAVEIISVITGTDPSTYSDGTGILGWFGNTNSQSSNLCVLVPIALAWLLTRKKWNPWLFWLTAIVGFTALYYFATRSAYLGIFAIGLGLSVSILLVRRKDWKVAVGLLALVAVFTGLLPTSPMMTHLKVNNGVQAERQGNINQQIGENLDKVSTIIHKGPGKTHQNSTEEPDEKQGMTEEERKFLIQELTPIYEFYVKDFVQIFGAEKTMEIFHYTIDIHDFSSVREKKLLFAQLLMNDSPLSAKFFGLNLARFTVNDNIYDVENDFHGIYYLYGAVGLGALLLFLLYFLYLIVWALIKNFKRYYTLEAASYGIALLLCLFHAYFTAGVLRRPNASIFLSAILAGIYYLVRLRQYPDAALSTKTGDLEKPADP